MIVISIPKDGIDKKVNMSTVRMESTGYLRVDILLDSEASAEALKNCLEHHAVNIDVSGTPYVVMSCGFRRP